VDIPEAIATLGELSAREAHLKKIKKRDQAMAVLTRSPRNIIIKPTPSTSKSPVAIETAPRKKKVAPVNQDSEMLQYPPEWPIEKMADTMAQKIDLYLAGKFK
jgi:hypothetical protein